LLSSLGGFVIRIRILMYRDVSCVYPEGYMYPSCILMYLKCILNALLHSKRIHVSWYFACILHVSQTSPRYILGYISDTSRYMYLGRFLGVTLDTYQDTSGYVYLGLFITIHLMIHQDTPRYKITIHVSWTLPWCHTGYISGYIRIRVSWTLHHDTSYDTSGYTEIQNHDTCILDASWRGTYLRCKIHSGYMRDTCICKGDQDTCGIHPRYMMRYMYLKCIQREMYLIWIETCGIHAGYMRDTCGTRISGVWGYPSAPASRARDTYPRMYPFVSDMYRACILCVMYLRVKIHCILNVSLLYPKCIVKKDTYP
jgi:hypothetical protein